MYFSGKKMIPTTLIFFTLKAFPRVLFESDNYSTLIIEFETQINPFSLHFRSTSLEAILIFNFLKESGK